MSWRRKGRSATYRKMLGLEADSPDAAQIVDGTLAPDGGAADDGGAAGDGGPAVPDGGPADDGAWDDGAAVGGVVVDGALDDGALDDRALDDTAGESTAPAQLPAPAHLSAPVQPTEPPLTLRLPTPPPDDEPIFQLDDDPDALTSMSSGSGAITEVIDATGPLTVEIEPAIKAGRRIKPAKGRRTKPASRRRRRPQRRAERRGRKKAAASSSAATGDLLRKRRHMSPGDVIGTATLGPRTRFVRALLSAVGIAIGISALVAVMGIPASFSAQAEADFDAMGANLVVVYPGQDRQTGERTKLPKTAPAMISRIRPVRAWVAMTDVPEVSVFRNDKIPEGQTGGISTSIAEGDPMTCLDASLAEGSWFDEATSQLPTVVLGEAAARRLRADIGSRIWIDNSWWAVIGILERIQLAQQLDATAFLAPGWATTKYPDLDISAIYVAAAPGKAPAVRQVMAATVNPANPRGVDVSGLSPMWGASDYFFETFQTLALGLGGISLLVGGIGIANTMVVSVMERRGEIGLRRALGARTGQIVLQFVLEAGVIGLVGGLLGMALGAYAVFCFTSYNTIVFTVPTWVMAAGPGLSIVVGMIAGLYPSLKAARQSPTVALRTV